MGTTEKNADYFFVNTMPILSEYVDECNGINHDKRQQVWAKMIHESEAFQRKPEQHLFICQSWSCYKAVSHEMLYLALQMTYLIQPNMCWVWGFCDSSLKPKGLIVVPYVAHSNLFTYSRAWNKREHKISFIGTLDRVSEMRAV